MDFINNIIDEKPLAKANKQVDFYKKDIRRKNFSLVNFFGGNVFIDR